MHIWLLISCCCRECRFFSCQLCNNTYMSWGNLVAHRKACHRGEVLSCDSCGQRKYHPGLGPVNFPVGDNPIGCEECGEGFNTVMQLYRHYRVHGVHQFMPHKGKLTKITERAADGSCSCPVCSAQFDTPEQLADHVARLSDDDTCYTCSVCQAKFCNVDVLVEHKRVHPNTHTCATCGKVLRNLPSLRRHQLSHNSERPYRCNWCPKAFTCKSSLEYHQYSHSKHYGYYCQECGEDFMEWYEITEHVEKNHTSPNEMLTCSICDCRLAAGKEFLTHYRACHVSKENEDTAKRRSNVTCPVCHKVFSQPSALSRHLKLHNPLTRHHICELCGEVVLRRDQILEHARRHYGDELPDNYKKLSEQGSRYRDSLVRRSFMCEYCGREFNKKLNLQLHVRRHTGERPYGCQLCGKAFYTNQQLAIHVRQHTGERPYACGICPKTFTGPTALYIHRKLHDKVKRHICPHCGKRFFWKSAFVGHIRLHTGERPYRCTICNKAFTLKGKLNLHLKKHAAEHTIPTCSDCGENFSSEEDLQAHRAEQCCVTMVTFVEEGPSGERDTRFIVVNTEDLERNNIYINDSEVVQLVV
ncbi:zinc finger protein 585A isoform X4 [Periplaneta americana]|uniref:zinc finger protein 585A isoform X4 n=1 Tax=Periplaneta americana TaxID=6978 RepID=UPI0037E848E6